MQTTVAADAALAAAYRGTHYEVQLPEGELLTLRVDVASLELQLIHERLRVSCSAFLTAWNPRSKPQSAALNAAANQQLRQQLAALGLACWPGRGRDPRGEWPPEESLFVPGLELAEATFHGRLHGQNAVLHAALDAVPRLVWLQPPPADSPPAALPR